MEKEESTTQTATQAFCKVCGPVQPTHVCPGGASVKHPVHTTIQINKPRI